MRSRRRDRGWWCSGTAGRVGKAMQGLLSLAVGLVQDAGRSGKSCRGPGQVSNTIIRPTGEKSSDRSLRIKVKQHGRQKQSARLLVPCSIPFHRRRRDDRPRACMAGARAKAAVWLSRSRSIERHIFSFLCLYSGRPRLVVGGGRNFFGSNFERTNEVIRQSLTRPLIFFMLLGTLLRLEL